MSTVRATSEHALGYDDDDSSESDPDHATAADEDDDDEEDAVALRTSSSSAAAASSSASSGKERGSRSSGGGGRSGGGRGGNSSSSGTRSSHAASPTSSKATSGRHSGKAASSSGRGGGGSRAGGGGAGAAAAAAAAGGPDGSGPEIAPGDVDVVVSFRKKMQSIKDLLDELYESSTQQVGYQTDGHLCVHNADKQEALHLGASLLYGEVLFEGVSKMLSSQHLAAANSDTLYDLGMGTGKLAMQAFFEFPNLKHVVGVEIAFSRYNIAERGAINLVANYPSDFQLYKWTKGSVIAVCNTDPKTGNIAPEGQRRVLEFRREDLFKSFDAIVADIIILQTDFPVQVHDALCSMASRFRRGTRVLSYLNFHKIWDCEFFPFPFASYAPNARFPTSWSPTNGGHMFHLWRKVMPAYKWHNRKTEQDESKFDGFIGLKKMSSLQFHKDHRAAHARAGGSGGGGGGARHGDGDDDDDDDDWHGGDGDEGGRGGSAKNIFKCLIPKKMKKKKKKKRKKRKDVKKKKDHQGGGDGGGGGGGAESRATAGGRGRQ